MQRRDGLAAVGLIRLRVVVLALIMAVLALAAGRIFDAVQGTLVVAAVAADASAMFPVLARRWYVQVPVAIGGCRPWRWSASCGSTGVGCRPTSCDAIVDGPRRLLSTEWPSPIRPDLTGTVAAMLAIDAALAAVLASKVRWHLLPLAPPLARLHRDLRVERGEGLGDRVADAAGAAGRAVRRVAPRAARAPSDCGSSPASICLLLTAVATGLAVAVSIPVAFADRADPRQIEPAETVGADHRSDRSDDRPPPARSADRGLRRPRHGRLHGAPRSVAHVDPRHVRRSTVDPDAHAASDRTASGARPAGRHQRRRSRSDPTTSPSCRFPGTPIRDRCRRPDRPGAHGRPTRRPPGRRPRPWPSPRSWHLASAGIGNAPIGIRPVDEISAGFTELANNLGGTGTVRRTARSDRGDDCATTSRSIPERPAAACSWR